MQKYDLIEWNPLGTTLPTWIDERGEPWWIYTQVADALGFKRSDMAAKHLRPRHIKMVHRGQGHDYLFETNLKLVSKKPGRGGARRLRLINQHGIIRLALRSKLPRAEDWQEAIEILIVDIYRGKVELRDAQLEIELEYSRELEDLKDRLEITIEERDEQLATALKDLERQKRAARRNRDLINSLAIRHSVRPGGNNGRT